MAWQSSTINPSLESPAASIAKLLNDLAVLRSVLEGGTDPGVNLQLAELVGGNTFTGAQTVATQALAVAGGSIATDAALSNTFRVLMTGNATLANPTNLRDGGIYNWRIRQDTTGGRTLAFGSKFKWQGGTAPTLTVAANAVDYITAQYFADLDILVGAILKDVR